MSTLIHLTQWRPGAGCDTNTSYENLLYMSLFTSSMTDHDSFQILSLHAGFRCPLVEEAAWSQTNRYALAYYMLPCSVFYTAKSVSPWCPNFAPTGGKMDDITVVVAQVKTAVVPDDEVDRRPTKSLNFAVQITPFFDFSPNYTRYFLF